MALRVSELSPTDVMPPARSSRGHNAHAGNAGGPWVRVDK